MFLMLPLFFSPHAYVHWIPIKRVLSVMRMYPHWQDESVGMYFYSSAKIETGKYLFYFHGHLDFSTPRQSSQLAQKLCLLVFLHHELQVNYEWRLYDSFRLDRQANGQVFILNHQLSGLSFLVRFDNQKAATFRGWCRLYWSESFCDCRYLTYSLLGPKQVCPTHWQPCSNFIDFRRSIVSVPRSRRMRIDNTRLSEGPNPYPICVVCTA